MYVEVFSFEIMTLSQLMIVS